jgi:cytoskeletal protein CcmA (bactofilin family)
MFRRKSTQSTDSSSSAAAGAARSDRGHLDPLPRSGTRESRNVGVPFHPDVPHRAADLPGQKPTESTSQSNPENKRLIVGKDIFLNGGEITDCDRLVVEGSLDGTMSGGRLLEIAHGGRFRGDAVVDNADVAGTFEGNLTVRTRLLVHASGQLNGTIRYGQLEVERGGQINGDVQADESNREADLRPVEEPPSESHTLGSIDTSDSTKTS